MTKAVILLMLKKKKKYVGQSEGVSFSFYGEAEGITYKRVVLRTLRSEDYSSHTCR